MFFTKQIEKVYRNQVYTRADDQKDVFYFDYLDFTGLMKENYSFYEGKNLLKGGFYYYKNYIEDTLVIFDHGMGGGHRAYMREIELLASFGYRVLAYDHTGCMESEGESTNGFSQSLRDLDACIKSLKEDSKTKDLKLIVMGHSWGAYSTMNIVAIHPDIYKIVALSGFISTEVMIEQNFQGLLKPYQKQIYEIEEKANPDYIKYNALNSLKHYQNEALLIYSNNDPLVKKEFHFDPLENNFKDSSNIHLLLVDGKEHNPNYTKEALSYKNKFFEDLKAFRKKEHTDDEKASFIQQYDWKKMTEQDCDLWKIIEDFLKKD